LKGAANPLVVNRALAEMLADSSERVQHVGLQLLEYVMCLRTKVGVDDHLLEFPDQIHRGCLVFYENLLGALSEKCIVIKWGRRHGIYQGICILLSKLGAKWSRKYEIEIMNVALLSLKSAPREMSMASMKTFEFVVQVCTCLYGEISRSDDGFVVDELLSKLPSNDDVPGLDGPDELGNKDPVTAGAHEKVGSEVINTKTTVSDVPEESLIHSSDGRSPSIHSVADKHIGDQNEGNHDGTPGDVAVACCPSQHVVQILLTEMASTNQLLR
jgi:hypothetical protein